jgi:KDO2-lipid IV(A) lauroyltransferase
MNTREKFTYYFLHFLSRYLNKISDRKREWYANKLAAFAYKYLPIRKNEAYKNIKLAFPNQNHQWLKKVLKGSYKTAVQNFIDFLAVSTTVHKTVFTIKNKNVLDEALDKNKGVLLITGHFGLWEKWGAWLGKNKYPLWGIIQRQANRGSDLFFKEIRESYGMSHIYKTSSVDQSYKILKQNQILILASDQDAKDKGVIVNFFNHKTSVPKGAALFHLKTGAALIFSVSTKNTDGSMTIYFEELKIEDSPTVESITQAYTKMLEDKISKFPDHYFWFHRKWKSTIS